MRIAVLAVHLGHLGAEVLGVAVTLPAEALAQFRALQEQMLAATSGGSRKRTRSIRVARIDPGRSRQPAFASLGETALVPRYGGTRKEQT
jgi:hypothetical protein